ncbi:hypothetical protein [Hydrogenophaga sp.]|uniref:hypothetical protein n=1 Tax=Hydrogenophaga sp. TaxID=1904254 RepID=UPI002FCBEF8E
MGRFISEVSVKVGLVGVDDVIAERLIGRFKTRSADDPGNFVTHNFGKLAECKSNVRTGKIHAICVSIEKFPPEEVVAFVSDIRVTHPLVPFCLVGTKQFLASLPNFHPAWKSRFSHYYQLVQDTGEDDFSENAGLLRDLLVADAVKCRALGQYETTPGAVIRLRAARPYGFWWLIVAGLLVAIVGGAVGPVLERFMPSTDGQKKAPTPSAMAPQAIPHVPTQLVAKEAGERRL